MHIFYTYNTLNLKEKIYSINKAYVWIRHYPPYHYKCLCYNMKDILMSLCVVLFQSLSITK